jgi:hypothetical protein
VRDLPQGEWTVKEHEDITLVVVHAKKAEAPVEPKAGVTAEKPAEEK